MDKHIFIINGSGGAGKDTFVKLVKAELNDIFKRLNTVDNYSSVDKLKEIAHEFGYNYGKTEKDRKFISDLKQLVGSYSDMPFKCMEEKVNQFLKNDSEIILFLHIREPNEIKRAAFKFQAKTILIKNNTIKHIVSNISDRNVFKYNYDFIIKNSGTIDDLYEKAVEFINNLNIHYQEKNNT